MKFKILLLLCITILLSSFQASYAGFLVKKHTFAADSASVSASGNDAAAARSLKKLHRLQALTTVKSHVFAKHDGSGPHRRRDTTGWEGIVSMICGILSLVSIPLGFGAFWLFIPAIIFGIIGMGHGKQHKSMAIAGLVMGIVAFILLILAIVIAIAFFSWLI